MSPAFEGSYMGADEKISARAVLECKICWTPYDPAAGDETRQIPPGTPFSALPADWKCPECDAPKNQFMVLEDPGAEPGGAGSADEAMAGAVRRLEATFREIHHGRMRGTPLCNGALQVEALGFRPHEGHYVGVLVAPWFMNLMVLPGPGEDWSDLKPGEKEMLAFPSGTYEFVHNAKDGLGGYKACSLFSPMAEFPSQLAATDVAREVMPALFDERNRAGDTDRADEIRRLREAELAAEAEATAAPPEPPADGEASEETAPAAAPSRRTLITGGLAGQAGA